MSRKSFFFMGGVISEGDGHKRVTRINNKTEEGVIVGGTQDEHDAHVERCMKANEVIRKNLDRDPDYIKSKVDEVLRDT